MTPRHEEFKGWDREAAQPGEFIQGLRDLGLFGLIIPEEHGGLGRPVDLELGDAEGPPVHDLVGRPDVQQRAPEDEGQAVAALGLVHVVGREHCGRPLGGDGVDALPELAAAHGVDACGRLVEK